LRIEKLAAEKRKRVTLERLLNELSKIVAEIDLARPAAPARLRHQQRDPLPFLIRQIRQVALRLLGDLSHSTPALLRPHRQLESRRSGHRKAQSPIFQTAS
jgi:hypothetical protein